MGIYLDYAAATPVDQKVLAHMRPFFSKQFHNPSALYEPARKAAKALSAARSQVAHCLGVKPAEIVFTAGATEANNLAIHGIMRLHPYTSMAISAIEHDSVLMPTKHYKYKIIQVNGQGLISPETVPKSITESTVLVSIIYASNEVGSVQPIRKIATLVAEIRKTRQKKGNKLPILFHIDGAQAGNYLDLHVHRLGVDMMTLNGGKLYGPKQSGVLYVRAGVKLLPMIEGGGQERGYRSGTENVAGAVGIAAALEAAQKMRRAESERINSLRNYFSEGILKLTPDSIINGPDKHRLPNFLHVTFPGYDNERLLMGLDAQGVYAAAGSACSASKEKSSHVLQAMEMDEKAIRSSVRFSLGRQTTKKQIDQTISVLSRLLADR